jgi:phage tail-like protein
MAERKQRHHAQTRHHQIEPTSALDRIEFFNAFPRKWEGPVFDAKGTDVAIETLTLCCERLERD